MRNADYAPTDTPKSIRLIFPNNFKLLTCNSTLKRKWSTNGAVVGSKERLRVQPVVSLALPVPTDPRLRKIVQSLITDPADQRDLDEWANEVGASKRTLTRLFPAQTGITFRTWRHQQRRLLRALELLASGKNVTTVALELGYENTSAFIAMFRRCLGQTPTQYLGNSAD